MTTRGHWPKGRRRHATNERAAKRVLATLAALLKGGPQYGRISRRKLAETIGVSDRTVRRWLAGEDLPAPDSLILLRRWTAQTKR